MQKLVSIDVCLCPFHTKTTEWIWTKFYPNYTFPWDHFQFVSGEDAGNS